MIYVLRPCSIEFRVHVDETASRSSDDFRYSQLAVGGCVGFPAQQRTKDRSTSYGHRAGLGAGPQHVLGASALVVGDEGLDLDAEALAVGALVLVHGVDRRLVRPVDLLAPMTQVGHVRAVDQRDPVHLDSRPRELELVRNVVRHCLSSVLSGCAALPCAPLRVAPPRLSAVGDW